MKNLDKFFNFVKQEGRLCGIVYQEKFTSRDKYKPVQDILVIILKPETIEFVYIASQSAFNWFV